jgi:Flp pilus assembly pilin Flp
MIVKFIRRRLQELMEDIRREDGQALVEYALLISLIAMICFGAVETFGLGVSSLFSKIVAQAHFP